LSVENDIAFFTGTDTAGDEGLWVTNGTAGGTFEVTGISGAGTAGIFPGDLTAFNGEVLFNASDTAGNIGLWVSNGKGAGTYEITGISGANTSSFFGPLEDPTFTVLNGEVVFSAQDTAGQAGLWVSNGTAAGTFELTGITNAYTGGIFDANRTPWFTAFNGEVLFEGHDAAGHYGLWVTNGTAAGTIELTGINGAYTYGFAPFGMTVFNGDVLFEGQDADGHVGLWLTNGTAAGTYEITGVSGLSTTIEQVPDFTPVNGEALFAGFDTAGQTGLWVTNGTGAGTFELTGISGAYTNGIFAPLSGIGFLPDFTVFNGEVLFAGRDTSGNIGLWVTNGTAAGTFELGGLANSGINGAYTGGLFALGLPDFVVLNGEVLFNGEDAAGRRGLWVTNGTAAGTFELTGISGAFMGGSGLAPSDLTAATIFGPQIAGAQSVTFTENSGAVALSPSLSLSDGNSTTLVGATVALTSTALSNGTFAPFAQATDDALTFNTAGTSITASYNSTTETLTLSGTDTLTDYQQVLESVAFNNTSPNPTNYDSDPTRTVVWTINDGTATDNIGTATETVDITAVSQPPTLSNVALSITYQTGSTVTLSSSASVSDPDNLDLVGATVSITGGTFSGDGDVLAASTAGTSITASYNAGSETLTLTGSDTLAHYQQVLDTITFNSTSGDPSDYGSDPTRTVTWALNDGAVTGGAQGGFNNGNGSNNPSTAITTIDLVHDAPTLSNVATSAFFAHGGSSVTLSSAVSVADPDSLDLVGATISIVGGTFSGDDDVLNATGTTSISVSYNSSSETLTLTGSDTLAHYQQVLDSVTFDSTSANPTNSGSDPTRTVTWTVNDGYASNGVSTPATTTISFQQVPNDFFGSGRSDLLWQNADGAPAIWEMNGTAVTGAGVLINPGAGWQIEASGDFNHNNISDIVLQNSDGLPEIWLMNGTSVTSTVTLPNPGPAWHVIATGDFLGNGNADILWQNNDGAAAIWEFNGTSIVGAGVLPNPGPTWHAIGAGDFNGDGHADILWQNNDGLPAIWEMNGTSIIAAGVLPDPGPAWHAIATGDFFGNGHADILWQNNDGLPAIWEMNGTSIVAAAVLPNPGPSWHAIGTGDFNGDGKADILWQNADGTPAIWEMNGFSIIGAGTLPNPGHTWQLKDDGPVSPDQTSASPPAALRLSSPDMPSGAAPTWRVLPAYQAMQICCVRSIPARPERIEGRGGSFQPPRPASHSPRSGNLRIR
jgi:ELWxxDGT repeat protein